MTHENAPGMPARPPGTPGPPKSRGRLYKERTSLEQPSPTARLATLVRRYVDREAEIVLEDAICIRVVIVDIRRVYGRAEFLVEPVVGSGSMWVTHRRLSLVDEEEI